ncbi:hypothetical protein ABBQ32_004670 [Trebouxia sp. C0010 RCD-2024]
MLQPPGVNPCLGPGAGKQPSSPSRQGQSPHARLQAARAFFAPSRTAGCKAGHPHAVLQGLVQALHQLPADLNQVARKDKASVGEMQAAVGMQLLEVLLIMTRSQSNRQRLLALGLLPPLATAVKAAISRLNTMAAIIGVQDSLQHVGPQLWFLQSLLGKLILIVHTCAGRSLRLCCRQGQSCMPRYLPGEARYCCAAVMHPGSRQEAEQMERIARPFLDSHMQVLLLELLSVLQLLRLRGANVCGEWEHLALQCLLAFVSASHQAQGFMQSRDQERNGLLMLTRGLGWPTAETQRPEPPGKGEAPGAGGVLAGPGLRSAEEELKAQLLALQVIGAAVKFNSNNLQTLCEAGGFRRITQLLQWTAFTFHPADTSGNGKPHTATAPHSPKPHGRAPAAPSSPSDPAVTLQRLATADDSNPALSAAQRSSGVASTSQPSQHPPADSESSHGPHGQHVGYQHSGQYPHDQKPTQHGHTDDKHLPHTRELEELFAVLSSWLSLGESRQGIPLWQMLMQQTTNAVLNAFRPNPAPVSPHGTPTHQDELHSTALVKLSQGTCILQHHALKFVSSMFLVEPSTLEHLRAEGLWDLAFGEVFFFWNVRHESSQTAPGVHGPQPVPQDPDRTPQDPYTSNPPPPEAPQPPPTADSPRPSQPPADDTLSAPPASHPPSQAPSQLPSQPPSYVPEGFVKEGQSQEAGQAQHRPTPLQGSSVDVGSSMQLLREHVVHVTQAAACLPGLASNEAESKKLLELLEDAVSDPGSVLVVAPSLCRIVQGAPGLALQALDKHDAITMLAYVVKKQQQLDNSKSPDRSDNSVTQGQGGPSAIWQARQAVLILLASYLHASPAVQRTAVLKWNVVAALFGLLWEERMQQPALDMIVGLMKVAPATEDDKAGKAALFTKYVEALPHALDSWKETGLGLVSRLLAGIQKVVQHNTALHQNLFRSAECFVQVLNLLNIDYTPEAGSQLCIGVLSTLTSLLAGNEASRKQLHLNPGFDSVLRAVLERTAPKGPSGDVLSQVLHLILEQKYREDSVMTIANVDAVPLYLHCLRRAAPELQLRGLQIWRKLLQSNMANLSAADRSGVNGDAISWFAAPGVAPACQERLAELLQVTGAYSISGRDLRALFGLLRRQGPSNSTPPYATLILRTLCIMARHGGPSAFFDFATDSAGILRTTPLQLPTSKGYSFATWLRIEEGGASGSGAGVAPTQSSAGRALYALLHRGGDTRGVIASLSGSRVVVRCLAPKLTEVALPFQFQASRWYHVVITHTTGSALSSSFIRMFVDGNLEASSRFKYAKIAEPMNACSFAAGLSSQETGVGAGFGAFHGQMGCIYLFEDVLNPGKTPRHRPSQVAALHALGPDYQSIFAPTDSNPLLEQTPAAAALLIHSKEALGPRLLLSYNAQAAAGRMLYNTTDMDGAVDVERDTAAVQEGSQLCCTCHLRDLLHCLGGVSVLLPLVAQLDVGVPHPSTPGHAEPRMVDVVELMAAVLEDSPSNRLTMLQTAGMALLVYLLQRCNPVHLNAALLHALETLLKAVTPSEALTKQLLQQLLLNLRLWSAAPPAGQRSLQHLILKLAKNEPAYFNELLPIPNILSGIRAHYWESPLPDSLKQAQAGSLTLHELREVRRGLLEVVGVFLRAAATQQNALSSNDIQALVSFVGDCPDTEVLHDVLELMCSLLHPHEASQRPLLACLADLGGIQLFMSLVQREQQSIRVLGLRIIAAFVPFPAASLSSPPGTTGGGSDSAGADGSAVWSALADTLLMFPLTKPVRLALLNLLCSQQGLPQSRPQGPPLITAAPVMGIMLGLLTGCDDGEERLATLTTLKRLIVEGPKENLAVITATPGWQEWLLELLLDGSPCLSPHPTPSSSSPLDYRHPRPSSASSDGVPRADNAAHSPWEWAGREGQAIRALLRALHGHCVQQQAQGWIALEQTACHLRLYAARGVVDGFGLLHELMADVVEDLSGQVSKNNERVPSSGPAGAVAAADAWLMVSSVSSEVCRTNAAALLGLVNELVGGTLIAPAGQELRPSAAATQWADTGGAQGVTPQAWASLGVALTPQAAVFQLMQQHWRLGDATWRLVYLLQKANDTAASLMPQIPRLARRRTPTRSPEGSVRPPAAGSGNAEAAGEEASVSGGLGDVITRLVLRLVLLYVQQAPLPRARDCVQQALFLLPHLLDGGDTLSRDRVLMLLAALSSLHAKLHSAGDTQRCQVLQTAMSLFATKFQALLLSSDPARELVPPASWLQGGEQQQGVVRAVQLECGCMQHECSRQAEAIQLLEAAADKRRMQERQQEHHFWDISREALGKSWTATGVLCASERSRRAAARVAHDEGVQSLARQWRRLHRNLTLDRGIWADTSAPHHYHWKLDKSEDSIRRRMKLKRNYHFVQYHDHAKGTPVASPAHTATPDRLLSDVLRLKSRKLDEEDLEGLAGSPDRPSSPVSRPPSPRASDRVASGDALDMSLPLSSDTLPDDDREARAAQSQQEHEQVIFTTACELVRPRHVVLGTLKILQGQIQFTGDLPMDEGVPGAMPDSPAPKSKEGRTHKVWPIAQVSELHHARYLLQPCALELFMHNHASALLSFQSPKMMRDVAGCIHSITGRIAIMDRKRKLEMANRLQLRWQRWEMTNYDYLMQLNTLAGRTFNDLNQYPVFPWVLADYTSASLDLNAAASYRNLSKPVGALNEKRRLEFQDRFESLKDDPEIPPFHYGSHYSSAGTVLFYLIRMEPFTAMNRHFQGGRFDHADRLFSNVGATWDNCLHSSSDVKELTPEFYHQPEFLLNSNDFELGTQQTGVELGDVVLPPWAHNSPDEFIRVQREALESDYVSEHLHEWVDLIFGFKQRGKEAQEACNVFYYLTYEGTVNLDQIEDPTQLKAVEEQIRNFGQTPSQLFKRRHVKRGPPPPPSSRPLLNAPSAMELVTVGQPNAKSVCRGAAGPT